MSERISWLDGWRGLACWLMVAYHLMFDLVMFGWVDYSFVRLWPVVVWQKFIVFSFILCAGWSATITHRHVRHGIITSLAGLVVVGASYVVGAPIRFGVLQFFGLAMLLYALVGKWMAKVPEKLAPFLWLGLFVVSWVLTESVRVEAQWLFWLGFRHSGFSSYDYVPMIPNVFLFLFGAWMGHMAQKYRERLPVLTKKAPAILTWPGKRTLWIYLIHQPVLYVACFVVFVLQNLVF